MQTKSREMSQKLRLTSPLNNPDCELIVTTNVSTGGIGSDTSPGVNFAFLAKQPCLFQTNEGLILAFGVVGREQIRTLRNLLTEFLLDHPEKS